MTEKNPKPIKRHPRLVPLSHDHHAGLMFAWKLKQGLAKQADPETMKDYIIYFWENDMQRHFEKEEELLLSSLEDEDAEKQRIEKEHKQIRALIKDIRQNPANEQIQVLSQSVHDHIRHEEREFFPYVEKKLTEEQLKEIGKALEDEQEFCDNWKEEFWK